MRAKTSRGLLLAVFIAIGEPRLQRRRGVLENISHFRVKPLGIDQLHELEDGKIGNRDGTRSNSCRTSRSRQNATAASFGEVS